MTIATSTSLAVGRGNGATTVFNYGFLIPSAANLVVVYTDLNGVQTILGPTQYNVTGLGNPQGGSVTYPLAGPPIAAGTTLAIRRSIPYTQPTALTNQGNYYPAVVEAALDNLEMQIQQAVASINAGIVYPPIDLNPVNVLPPAAARAGKFFGFDGNGNPVMLPGNLLAGDLLPYTLGGAVFTTPKLATMNAINMNAGWYVQYSTALASLVQGLSAFITRTAGADPNFTVGAMISTHSANGVTASNFGVVSEAVNDPGGASNLVGNESCAGNQTNNCLMAKTAYYAVFKDRGDGVATVVQGLGANEYNLGALAYGIYSQPRSTAGEFCGFRRGIYFDPDGIDADVNGGGIGIDFAKVRYYGGGNPLTAYRMTAAIRMRDFQSILWNADPTLPNDPTEPAANAVRQLFDSNLGRIIISNAGFEKFGIDVSTGDIYKAGVIVTGASLGGNNTWTGTNTFNNTVTIAANLTFSGVARRILADFSNATVANRTIFQTTTVNGATDIPVLPNGASPNTAINFFNGTDPTNAAYLRLAITNNIASIQSTQAGAATALPLTFYAGASGGTEGMRLSYPNQQLLIATTVESAVTGAKLRVNGIVAIDNTCAFSVHNNSVNFNVTTGIFTKVTFSTKEFDQNNSFNVGTSRFTPPAGKYLLCGATGITGGIANQRLVIGLMKSGANVKNSATTVGGANPFGVAGTWVVDASGTDYFEIFVFQDSGGTETFSGASVDTYFMGYRIG